MDCSDSEYEMLDLLAWNCNQLSAQLADAKSPDDESKIITEYLKKVDEEFSSVSDFKEGELVLLRHASGRWSRL